MLQIFSFIHSLCDWYVVDSIAIIVAAAGTVIDIVLLLILSSRSKKRDKALSDSQKTDRNTTGKQD